MTVLTWVFGVGWLVTLLWSYFMQKRWARMATAITNYNKFLIRELKKAKGVPLTMQERQQTYFFWKE